MATATISKSKVTKKYTSAADNITVTGSSNKISTMGGKDKVTLSKGSSNIIDAGAGNDTIIVNGGNKHKLRGGTGSDTYIINSKITKSTRITIDQSDYKKKDADILRLSKVHMMDMSYSLENGTLTMTHKNGGKITVPGWDKNPLSKIEFANHQATPFMDWSITGKQINNFLALASGNVINVTQKGKYKGTKSKDLFRFKGFGWTATVQGADKSDALDLSWYGSDDSGDGGLERKGNDLCFTTTKGGSGSKSSRTATIIIKNYFTSKSKLGKIALYDHVSDGRWPERGFDKTTLYVLNLMFGKNGTSGDDCINATKAGTLKGGSGNDWMWGCAGKDYLYGEAGNDVIDGRAGNDKLYGGSGNDELDGDEGNDKLYGGPGHDWLCDLKGKNELYGEAGNDTLQVNGNVNQLLSGGTGSDSYRIYTVQSGVNVTIDQSGYNKGDKDVLHLAYVYKENVNYSYSASNNGTLTIAQQYGGIITVKGWDKNPLSKIVFANQQSITASAIKTALNSGNVISISKSGTYDATTYKDIFQFSGEGWNAVIKGATSKDKLDFSKYMDREYGLGDFWREGNDLKLTYLEYNNTFDEGERVVGTIAVKDYFTSADKIAKVTCYDSDDDFYGTDQKVLRTVNLRIDEDGTAGDDLLFSLQGKNTFDGGAGNDFIWGGENASIIHGGDGDDVIEGSEGNDKIYGDAGNDALYGKEGDNELYGGSGDDVLKTYAGGANILYGEEGDDKLYVGGENDIILDGGKGSDCYDVTYIYPTTDLKIDQNTYDSGDSDILNLTYVHLSDVTFALQNHALIIESCGGKVTIDGWDVNPLSKIVFADGTELTSDDVQDRTNTLSDSSESSLAVVSIQKAIIDFPDTQVSDSMSGVQQEDTSNISLFITGNI